MQNVGGRLNKSDTGRIGLNVKFPKSIETCAQSADSYDLVMGSPVNLDALVRREDFEVKTETVQGRLVDTIAIRDLEGAAFFYATLRKPDFQRETGDWEPKKISEFVRSFLEGDLIPAIILWNSGSNNFVIDGAHRLSALVAWVNDDYGDKRLSREFFEDRIPDEQIDVAEQTRNLIRKTVGTYEDHKLAVTHPERFEKEVVTRAKLLATLALQLQWVKGDATKAEASFFKINQQAAPIDPTELKLLKARKSSNAMAARAIIRSGTGHKYWSKFDRQTQDEIEKTAKAIHSSLFVPKLTTPIKTLDLPVAGRGYSAQTLPLVFELVNIANDLAGKGSQSPDTNGRQTLLFLHNTKRIVDRIVGVHPSSLGLHPAVYFYSANGRYQPTAFLAIAELIKELDKVDKFREFTGCRVRFEAFLLKHKTLVNQVTLKFGSGIKGFQQLKAVLKQIFDFLVQGNTEDQLLGALLKIPQFSYLQPGEQVLPGTRKDFDSSTKSAAFLRDALATPLRCKICGGLIHANSITFDHIERKQDGGLGEVANAQLAHPYCNSTVKN